MADPTEMWYMKRWQNRRGRAQRQRNVGNVWKGRNETLLERR